MKPTITLIATLAGVVSLAASALWSSAIGPEPNWTEAQAEELALAQARYHQLGHQHSDLGTTDGHAETEQQAVTQLDEAKLHFERLDADLHRSIARHGAVGRVFKWLGIGLILVGVLTVLFKPSDR